MRRVKTPTERGENLELAAAKLTRITEMVADSKRLKAMSKSERPGEVSINEVRDCGADCLETVLAAETIEDLEDTMLPSDRLAGGGEG